MALPHDIYESSPDLSSSTVRLQWLRWITGITLGISLSILLGLAGWQSLSVHLIQETALTLADTDMIPTSTPPTPSTPTVSLSTLPITSTAERISGLVAQEYRAMQLDPLEVPTQTPGPTMTPSPTASPIPARLTRIDPLSYLPTDPEAWDTDEPFRFVEETRHNLALNIKLFYDAQEGETRFGYPLTELMLDPESGRLVQYFERARIEVSPDNPADIQLTASGSILTEGRRDLAFRPLQDAPANDPAYFAETGYRISDTFYDFWKTHGDVELLGYPISRVLIERLDGPGRLVQYFERARLEYYPEFAGTPRAIQMGHLGSELFRQQNVPTSLLAPAVPIVKLSSATTTFGDSAGTQNALLAARYLHGQVVQPGATLSFLASLGEISEQVGYTQGAAIVNGRIVPVIAGGICQTSTTLYRAAFQAGIAITERHAHSLYIAAFNDVVSFDAAVFSPGLDLKMMNDTPYPILVTASGTGGEVTVEFWGRSDGRTTRMLDPEIRAELAPAAERWYYDPELPADTTEQTVSPRSGLEVVLGRVVTAADGAVLHNDSFFTTYDPVAGEIRYGAEVTPPEGAIIEGDLPPTPTPTEVTPTEGVPTEVIPTEGVPTEVIDVPPGNGELPPDNGELPPENTESPTPEGPARPARSGAQTVPEE